MVSGELAARAIIDAHGGRAGDNVVQRYRDACHREMGQELSDSLLIQRYLFSDRRRITRIISSATRHPAITKLILDYAIGCRSYRAVRRRLLARSPHLALSLVVELAKSFTRSCRQR